MYGHQVDENFTIIVLKFSPSSLIAYTTKASSIVVIITTTIKNVLWGKGFM